MEKMKSKLFFILVLLLGFMVILDLFHAGLPITHDGQDHVARIANFYTSLAEGNIIPRWAGNLNWGYGHPILEFLYPLPSYTASFFHFVGFSLIDSVKFVFGLGIILSGIFMFVWLAEFLGPEASLVGSILYMLAPYRLVDLYVRGDIGENLAFAFMPFALYFILKLSRKVKAHYILAVASGIALLILSHNAISLIFMPFIVFYGLFIGFYTKEKKRYFLNFAFSVVLGLGLSAFFWIPGLLEAKYTLRNIVTKGGYLANFVNLESIFYGPWNYGISGQFTVQYGIMQWLFIIISPFVVIYLKLKKNKDLIILYSLIIYLLLATFIMFPQSNFIWSRFIILQNFQFPWRFLGIIVFSSSFIAALVYSKMPNKIQKYAIVLFIILFLLLNKDYWHASGYSQKPEQFFTGIYNSTTDTGESSPIWSIRFMEKRPIVPMEVIGGKGTVVETLRRSTLHSYKIEALDKVQLRENTVYFPGWEVRVDGKTVPIEFQSGVNRGVITFFVERGKHSVDVVYTETRLRFISDLISAGSLFMILIYNIWSIKLWRKFL